MLTKHPILSEGKTPGACVTKFHLHCGFYISGMNTCTGRVFAFDGKSLGWYTEVFLPNL